MTFSLYPKCFSVVCFSCFSRFYYWVVDERNLCRRPVRSPGDNVRSFSLRITCNPKLISLYHAKFSLGLLTFSKWISLISCKEVLVICILRFSHCFSPFLVVVFFLPLCGRSNFLMSVEIDIWMMDHGGYYSSYPLHFAAETVNLSSLWTVRVGGVHC